MAELAKSWCFEEATLGVAALNAYYARKELLDPLGATYDEPIELPDGTGDAAYLDALDLALVELDSRFRPDAVFYLAGADPFEGDRLGRLKLTKAGLAARDALVLGECRRLGLPVAIAMAGGYARNIDDTVDIHAMTVTTAARLFRQPRAASL